MNFNQAYLSLILEEALTNVSQTYLPEPFNGLLIGLKTAMSKAINAVKSQFVAINSQVNVWRDKLINAWKQFSNILNSDQQAYLNNTLFDLINKYTIYMQGCNTGYAMETSNLYLEQGLQNAKDAGLQLIVNLNADDLKKNHKVQKLLKNKLLKYIKHNSSNQAEQQCKQLYKDINAIDFSKELDNDKQESLASTIQTDLNDIFQNDQQVGKKFSSFFAQQFGQLCEKEIKQNNKQKSKQSDKNEQKKDWKELTGKIEKSKVSSQRSICNL